MPAGTECQDWPTYETTCCLPGVSDRRGRGATSASITHLNVIDATGAPVRQDTTVVVTGERISVVGPSGSVKIPAGARIVDGSGKFLIPGQWDKHAHTAYTGLLAGSRETFPSLLVANGITGIRDVGFDLEELQDRGRGMAEGRLPGSRIFASGPMLDGPVPRYPGSIGVATPEKGVRMIQTLKRRGADFIKIRSAVPRPAYFAIVKEAYRLGLPVAGHVPDAVPIGEVADSGRNSIEHIGYILDPAVDPAQRKVVADQSDTNPALVADYYSREQAAAIAQGLRKNGTRVCPTLVRGELTPLDEINAKNDPHSRYLPDFIIDNIWPKHLGINQINAAPEKIKAARLNRRRKSMTRWSGCTEKASRFPPVPIRPRFPFIPASVCAKSWPTSCRQG